jgi:transcriptional regulatory protein LevR
MKLDIFKEQLTESRMGDMHARVKELRALNNSADEICKKVASEFQKDYNDVKKLLLPMDLKRYATMSTDELNKVGEAKIKALKSKYGDNAATSRAGYLKKLMDEKICK